MTYSELKRNNIVSIMEDNNTKVNVIVLPITKKDLKRGVFAIQDCSASDGIKVMEQRLNLIEKSMIYLYITILNLSEII